MTVTALLLVTWFSGNAVNSYHIEFKSIAACDKAREALIYDYAKSNGGSAGNMNLSVVCVEK